MLGGGVFCNYVFVIYWEVELVYSSIFLVSDSDREGRMVFL